MKHKVESRLLESERKFSRSVVSDSLQPHGLPPGSSLHGILQARLLEWVAMPVSRGSSQPRDQTQISYVSFIWNILICLGLIPGLGRSSGKGNGYLLQYSCLENSMDGGAWWATVHGVARSRTRLSNFDFTFHFHALEKEMATRSSVLAWRINP